MAAEREELVLLGRLWKVQMVHSFKWINKKFARRKEKYLAKFQLKNGKSVWICIATDQREENQFSFIKFIPGSRFDPDSLAINWQTKPERVSMGKVFEYIGEDPVEDITTAKIIAEINETNRYISIAVKK